MPDETPKKILTEDEWKARQTGETKWPARRSTSLNKGGSVDIYTSAAGEVVAILRFAKLTAEIEKEVTPLLAKAEAKAQAAAQEKAAAQPQ